MTPLFIALPLVIPMMQGVDPAPDQPPQPPTVPVPAPATQPAPPPLAPPGPMPPMPTPLPPTWDQPYGQPPAQPLPPQPFPPQPPSMVAPKPEEPVSWFARVELGLGTYGFGENNSLLSDVGYAGIKMWVTLDAAWMFHRNVGAGILLGMNRQSSQPETAPDMNAVSYFVTAELPIMIAGNRAWAIFITPRGGYAAAELEFDNDQDADLLHTGTFGGAFGFQSFKYHIGSSIGFMRTPTGPPGTAARDMDFGGLYFTLGGTIDG